MQGGDAEAPTPITPLNSASLTEVLSRLRPNPEAAEYKNDDQAPILLQAEVDINPFDTTLTKAKSEPTTTLPTHLARAPTFFFTLIPSFPS